MTVVMIVQIKKSVKILREQKKNNNWFKYHIPGCSNIHRIKKNVIFISDTNTIRHELAKSLGAIMLSRFGDIKFNARMIAYLTIIDEEIKLMNFAKNPTDFLTEAVPNSDSSRRIDLVSLKDCTHYEFETNHKIKKDGAVTIYL